MNPEVAAAFEFGFRCAEKGMNLQRAQEELAAAYNQPRISPEALQIIDAAIEAAKTRCRPPQHNILYHHD